MQTMIKIAIANLPVTIMVDLPKKISMTESFFVYSKNKTSNWYYRFKLHHRFNRSLPVNPHG